MKLAGLMIVCGVLAVMSVRPAVAGPLDRIDVTQPMDLSEKNAKFGTLDFKTLSNPQRASATAPLKKGDLQFSTKDMKGARLETLDYTNVSTPSLPQANFVAKRSADAEKVRDTPITKQQPAPIKDREIRAFRGGEDELKDQLHHLPK